MAERRVAAADGTELAVTIEGSGPALLLIPGLGATRVVFAPLRELLTPYFTVAVYDQRGIGASQVTPGPYTTTQLAGDAAAVLEGLDMDAAAVMGASFGGMVAQQLAIAASQRLRVLVLAATGPGDAHLVQRPERSASEALLGKGARTPEDAYRVATTVLYSQAFRAAHPDVIDRQVHDRASRPVSARAFQAQLAASRGHDAWDRLPSITAPTLVMHGSEDAVMPLANARALAERIPGAQLAVFDGAGHLFFHEEPGRAAEMLRAFASAHP